MLKRSIPLIIFLLLAGLLWRGLSLNPHQVPSALLDKQMPRFSLMSLGDPSSSLSDKDFSGQVVIFNVWASWCPPCRDEMPVLMHMARTTDVPIYGLNYKDGWQTAQDWLAMFGNPFVNIGYDREGSVAIDWGVYGAPETFVIDRQGVIRYKHLGALTMKDWQETLLPLVEELKNT